MYIVAVFLEYSTPNGFISVGTTDDQFVGPFSTKEEAEEALVKSGLGEEGRPDASREELMEKGKYITCPPDKSKPCVICRYKTVIIKLSVALVNPVDYIREPGSYEGPPLP